jgi:germination protein M
MKRISLPLILGIVLALLLAACGRDAIDAGPVATDDETEAPAETEEPPEDTTEPEPTPTEAPTAEAPTTEAPTDEEPTPDADVDGGEATSTVRLYYLAPGGETAARPAPFLVSVRQDIPKTERVALATLRELVEGPSASATAMIDGLSTAVPAETLVLDVTIDDRVATVNLSREFESGGGSFSMFARLAQVVYTATQFPTVDEVQFELDGRPVTVFSGEGIVLDGPISRADYVDLLPLVFVDTPAAGAEIHSPLRITGMAAVFEATFQYRVEDADGEVLAEGHAMSDNGMGWGTFDVTIDLDIDESQPGTLTVWEYSAKDGSVQGERVTPLLLSP